MNDNESNSVSERKGGRPGRPCKFTPATRARLIELIARGLPFNHACAAVRISVPSFNTYKKNNPDFVLEIEEAVAAAIEKRLAIIEKAADLGDVNSAKWFLERVHYQSFGRNRVEVTGADGSPLAAAIAVYLPKKDGALPTVTIDTKEIENEE